MFLETIILFTFSFNRNRYFHILQRQKVQLLQSQFTVFLNIEANKQDYSEKVRKKTIKNINAIKL